TGYSMSPSIAKLTLWFAASLVVACPLKLIGQSSSGTLVGSVSFADGKPAAGVTVVVTNQTSGEESSRRTDADGRYSFQLRSGAYRIKLGAPHEARFDRGKVATY